MGQGAWIQTPPLYPSNVQFNGAREYTSSQPAHDISSAHLDLKASPTGLSASTRCRQSRTRDTSAVHSPSRVAGQPALVAQCSMSASALSTSSGASSPAI
jgi:hypothetical protein